jgi:CDP-diacylglycerol---glycerol-3-phosphate 3-phosphatidyltransferase
VEAGSLNSLKTARTLAFGTGLRIVASPIVLALMLGHSWTLAGLVFAVAAATDWFDGRLARAWNAETKLGSFLDTTADKLLVSTGVLALVAVHRGSAWVALIVIGREFAILGLRTVVVSGGTEFKTSMLGKWKATIQFVAITVAIFRPDVIIAGAYLDQWLMVIAAIVTAWSGIDYLWAARSALEL